MVQRGVGLWSVGYFGRKCAEQGRSELCMCAREVQVWWGQSWWGGWSLNGDLVGEKHVLFFFLWNDSGKALGVSFQEVSFAPSSERIWDWSALH